MILIKSKIPTNDEIYDFCKGHYYSDVEEKLLWEPFEDYAVEDVEIFIKNDVDALKDFLGIE